MQLVKTVDGVKISVDSEGRFHAEIGSRMVKRASISPIVKMIEALRNPLKVYVLRETCMRALVREYLIVSFSTISRRARKTDGNLLDAFTSLYLCAPEEVKRLQDILDEYAILDEEWREIVNGLQHVDHRNFDKLRKETSDGGE